MKTGLFSCIFSVCIVHYGAAQQVYQSQDFGGPGTQNLYSSHVVGTGSDLYVAAGADTVWDVGDLLAEDLALSEIVTRDEGMDAFIFTAFCSLGGINILNCLSIWNNTQQAWSVVDSQTLIQFVLTDIKRFQRKTSTQLLENFLGLTADINGSATPGALVYQTPDTVLNFPLTYGNQWTSKVSWQIDLSATGQNIQYKSHQTRSASVDAWGTLITPYDTLEGVLRTRAVITRNDTLTTDSLSVPITLRQLEYMWFDTSYGLPVMIANGIVTDTSEIIASVSYLVDAECDNPVLDVTAGASTYYLNENDMATAVFSVGNSNTGTFAWSFGDGAAQVTEGGVAHTYINPGIYTITVTGCMTNCLPQNTCADQFVTIEVVDTTSAVHFVDPGALGIKLFPNPVRDVLTIERQDHSNAVGFTIVNTIGAILLTGTLDKAQVSVDLSDLGSGYYCIQFYDDKVSAPLQAIRFAIIK